MKDALNYGYWLYKDGKAYWGIRLYRGTELPEPTTKRFASSSTPARLRWLRHQEYLAYITEYRERRRAELEAKLEEVKAEEPVVDALPHIPTIAECEEEPADVQG